jgi:hypothetical protein
MRRRHACLLALVSAVTLCAHAGASGGRYVFDGGTAAQRDEVRRALQASAFDWDLVPGRVTIHIRRGIMSEAAPRQIWLDAGLLDTGTFSWGVIQHEFAHQIDYLLLTEADRTALQALLGGQAWCTGAEGLGHDDNACERFATSLSWAYWPSPQNVFDPAKNRDEPWLRASPLRALLASLLGVRDPFPVRQTLSVSPSAGRPTPA